MAEDVIRDVPTRNIGPAGVRLRAFEKASWSAIWAGAMVTLGVEMLFLSFGIFIGAAIGGSTDWTMAWYLVTMAISFYAGAFTTARLTDVSTRQMCVLNAFSTWGLANLASLLLVGLVALAGLRLGVATGAIQLASISLMGAAEMWAGVIWGGVLLSLASSYLGGITGIPSARIAAETELPAAPMRRAG